MLPYFRPNHHIVWFLFNLKKKLKKLHDHFLVLIFLLPTFHSNDLLLISLFLFIKAKNDLVIKENFKLTVTEKDSLLLLHL